MSAEYSVEEVRAQAMYEKGKLRLQTMLFDLANRIKADECAVPVAEVVAGYSIKWLGPDFACSLVVGTKLFTHPPAQVAQVDDKVVVIRDGRATTEGLVLAAAIYMGAVKDIFALRFDGPPYNERKVTRDDAALRAFDHLDAATKGTAICNLSLRTHCRVGSACRRGRWRRHRLCEPLTGCSRQRAGGE